VCQFDPFIPAGTVTQTVAFISPYTTDSLQSNNGDTLSQIVLSSFDPNFKEVAPSGTILPAFVQNQGELEYTIHFQNTGNDTAFTVAIADTISSNLDLNSLRIVSSSHNCYLDANSSSRRVEFIFNNIFLPDSTTDEPNSHGFVKYAIRPLSSLIIGDSILNNASIYFDFNLPVVTNTTVTRVDATVSVINHVARNEGIRIFPNPSDGFFTLSIPPSAKQIRVLNAVGQVMQSIEVNDLSEIHLAIRKSGVYFIQVITEQEVMATKIVVAGP